MPKFKTYCVWANSHYDFEWRKTFHKVKGQTQKQAQRNVERKFRNAGFSGVSLLAVVEGDVPNNVGEK